MLSWDERAMNFKAYEQNTEERQMQNLSMLVE